MHRIFAFLKALATMLMILVLFLVGQPVCSASARVEAGTACCGQPDCSEGDEAPGQEHGSDCAGCNPFQSCSCCVVGLIIPSQPQIRIDPVPACYLKAEMFSAPRRLQGRPQPGIWQPPRQA